MIALSLRYRYSLAPTFHSNSLLEKESSLRCVLSQIFEVEGVEQLVLSSRLAFHHGRLSIELRVPEIQEFKGSFSTELTDISPWRVMKFPNDA